MSAVDIIGERIIVNFFDDGVLTEYAGTVTSIVDEYTITCRFAGRAGEIWECVYSTAWMAHRNLGEGVAWTPPPSSA